LVSTSDKQAIKYVHPSKEVNMRLGNQQAWKSRALLAFTYTYHLKREDGSLSQ